VTTDGDLVRRLRAGDHSAWTELLRRHAAVVWVVARSHRLDRTDAADAVQNTWIALAEYLPRLTDPERLRAWLVTTARRESLRIQEKHRIELPTDAPPRHDHVPDPNVLRTARDRALWHAFDSLPDRCRTLLALHANAPELTHAQLARLLELTAGSVGRTKHRCLDRLRRLLAQYEEPG
jgi:RNA polymerase sigma factor (sigma-70 family)